MKIRNKNGLTQEEFLKAYDPSKWERPSVTVDVMLYAVAEKSVLLIRRGDHPFIGRLALPGGFVNPDETVHAAACRELFEETNVVIKNLKQINIYSQPNRDPRTRIITAFYVAVVDNIIPVTAGDDAAEADWYAVNIKSNKKGGKVSLSLDGSCITYEYKRHEALSKYFSNIGYSSVCDEIASDHGAMIAEGLEYIENILVNYDIPKCN